MTLWSIITPYFMYIEFMIKETCFNITTLQSGLQPSFSHHLYCVCVNFVHDRRDLQLNVDCERQKILRNFFMTGLLISEFLPEICWEEITEEIFPFFSYYVFMPDLGYKPGPTHSLLDYGDWVLTCFHNLSF